MLNIRPPNNVEADIMEDEEQDRAKQHDAEQPRQHERSALPQVAIDNVYNEQHAGRQGETNPIHHDQ